MDLCREFGPDNVGLATGDATVNRDAPVLCCTAEILANIALREGAEAAVDDVVMDEFHWYADRDRGVAWQAPLLTLPRTRFLLMSATLGDVSFFEQELTRRTGRETATVTSSERPVPLEYAYSEEPLAKAVERLVDLDRVPVYVVHFTQKDAAASAQSFTSLQIATRPEKHALAAAVEDVRFSTPYGPRVRTWLKHGIGIHHAGLLPRYRVLAERLAQRGLLKVICGTDTLGVGVNVPIRTVPLQPPLEVRRREDGGALGPRLPPDRRARGAQGLRRARLRRRPSPRARHREPAARREGEGRQEVRPPPAPARQLRALGRRDVRAPRPLAPRAAPVALRGLARHAAQRAVAPRRRLRGDAPARAGQPRDGRGQARAPAPKLAALPVAGGARGRRDRAPHPRGLAASGERRSPGRLLDGPGAVALPHRDHPAARPRRRDPRPRPAHARGEHPREPRTPSCTGSSPS